MDPEPPSSTRCPTCGTRDGRRRHHRGLRQGVIVGTDGDGIDDVSERNVMGAGGLVST